MSRPIPCKRLIALTGAVILAGALAGCGKVGQLEPAKPLFGHKTGAPAPPQQDVSRPIENVDPRDRVGDTPQVPPPPGAQPTPQ